MKSIAFSIIKPESLFRGLVGKIISDIESKGFRIIIIKSIIIDSRSARELYKEYDTNTYSPFVIRNICLALSKGKSLLLVLEGDRVIENMRNIIGYYKPEESEPGSIRGKYISSLQDGSILHVSDNVDNIKRELNILDKDMYDFLFLNDNNRNIWKG